MQHIIKKQLIELTLDKRLNHFHIQHLVSKHYHNDIIPVLQKVFDKIGNEDQIIELDKLEIDLGILTEKSIEKNEWTALLQNKIEELLTKIIESKAPADPAHSKPKRLSIFKQWFFYMQNGYLPWNALKAGEGWYQQVLEALAIDFESVQLLRQAVRLQTFFLKRIVAQHNESFLQNLAEIFTAQKQDELPAAIDEMIVFITWQQTKDKAHTIKSEREIKKQLWAEAIQLAAVSNETTAQKKIAEQVVMLVLKEKEVIKSLPAVVSKKLQITLPYFAAFIKNVQARVDNETKLGKAVKKEKDIRVSKKLSLTNNEAGVEKTKEPSIKGLEKVHVKTDVENIEFIERESKSLIHTLDEEGIFVANAGVVLLHPFLNSLFKRLNLVSEGKFVNENLHQQALYIVHYLSMGNTIAEEHELTIAKVLCAYPLDEPVDNDIEIKREMLNEAVEMIGAALQQWDKLQNTSPAGLREGFLQRNGKLHSKSGTINLQVEKSAIDVLLDYLPWNLSMIKLPWMKDILRVEWR